MELSKKKSLESSAEGVAFLEENAKKEGVVTTESGLQYEILTNGVGASPVESDQVSVHYHGTLIDGTVFDSLPWPAFVVVGGLNLWVVGDEPVVAYEFYQGSD